MSLKHLLNLPLASERATPRAKMKASSIFTSLKKSGMEACGLNAPDCYMVKKVHILIDFMLPCKIKNCYSNKASYQI